MMRRGWAIVVLCGAMAAASGLRGDEAAEGGAAEGEALGIAKSFFAEADAGKRKLLAEKFAGVAPKSWDEVRRVLHRAAAFADLKAGRHNFETKAGEACPAVKYVLRIPAGYRAASDAGWPVIIGCHGVGGNGEGFVKFLENVLGADIEKYVVACADAPQQDVYRSDRAMVEYPLVLLDDVRHRANVDSDRAVLMGYSRGGYTTWGTILFSPGEWAGAVPMAAWPVTEAGSAGATLYLPNVVALGIQAHWGENDIEPGQKSGINTLSREVAAEMKRLGAKKFEGVEYAGQGHGLKLDGEKIREFAASARREAFPSQGRLVFHAVWQGRAWNVRALSGKVEDFDFKRPRTVQISRAEDLAAAKRKMLLGAAFEIKVAMPPGANAINVTAKDVKEVEIELPAEGLDFGKPIRVTSGGRQLLNEKRGVDWAELLETARRTYDFERLVAGRIRASPGR